MACATKAPATATKAKSAAAAAAIGGEVKHFFPLTPLVCLCVCARVGRKQTKVQGGVFVSEGKPHDSGTTAVLETPLEKR